MRDPTEIAASFKMQADEGSAGPTPAQGRRCVQGARIRTPMAKAAKAETAGPPTAQGLRKLLGASYAAYEALTARDDGSTCEWKRYNEKAPWALKVSRADRTLFYVKPASGSFEVTVVLGPRATEAALAGRVPKSLHASIRAARAYAEGRPVRVVVTSEADLVGIEQLVAVKLAPKPKR